MHAFASAGAFEERHRVADRRFKSRFFPGLYVYLCDFPDHVFDSSTSRSGSGATGSATSTVKCNSRQPPFFAKVKRLATTVKNRVTAPVSGSGPHTHAGDGQ